MRDSELDRILSTAARRPIEVSPAVLERIARSLRTSIQPVRPLPPTWVLTARLLALNSLISVAGAALPGFDAIGSLNPKGQVALFVIGQSVHTGKSAFRRTTGTGHNHRRIIIWRLCVPVT